MNINEIATCGVPFRGKLIVKVNVGEIPLAPADFCDAETIGFFKVSAVDADDRLKVVGMGVDGNIYVSDKYPLSLTDEEITDYFGRQGVTDESVKEMFLYDESPINPINSEYSEKFSY